MNYCVIDLEFCVIPKARRLSKKFTQELVQLACVVMDEGFNIISFYKSFVKPSFGGVIDPFISNLTGIKESDLKGSPSAREVIEHLSGFFDNQTSLVTWGENDVRVLLNHLEVEVIAGHKAIEVSDTFLERLDQYIDCQVIFGETMNSGKKKYRLSEALLLSDVECSGKFHDAYYDALNTALLFKKLRTEDNFRFSPYFIPADKADSICFDPFKHKKHK